MYCILLLSIADQYKASVIEKSIQPVQLIVLLKIVYSLLFSPSLINSLICPKRKRQLRKILKEPIE